MMKKFKILVALLIILIPYHARALTGNLAISCSPTSAKAGDVVKCTVSGNTDEIITAISADISLTSNLTLESFSLSGNWQGDDVSNNKLDVYTSDDVKSNFTIGTISVKIKNDVVNINELISLKSIVFYDVDGNENSITDVNASIRVPNNDNTLSSLKIEGLDISPNFSSDISDYSATTTSSSINIIATATDSNASVIGTGVILLSTGKNNFKIAVTAEDGSVRTYNLDVIANISNEDNNNSSSGSGTKDITNPKTGEFSIIFVIVLLAISAISVIYFKKRAEQN